jgi:hypothetical protein
MSVIFDVCCVLRETVNYLTKMAYLCLFFPNTVQTSHHLQ